MRMMMSADKEFDEAKEGMASTPRSRKYSNSNSGNSENSAGFDFTDLEAEGSSLCIETLHKLCSAITPTVTATYLLIFIITLRHYLMTDLIFGLYMKLFNFRGHKQVHTSS